MDSKNQIQKREIKFRAWVRDGEWEDNGDKRKFVMIDSDSLCSIDFEPLKDTLKDIEDEYYVMQYTGLKDKNGKEIYEGDIIKEGTENQIIWDEDGILLECPIGEVKIYPRYLNVEQIKRGRVKLKSDLPPAKNFLNNGDGYSEINLSCYDGVFEWPDDVEVIGNIYENPELLTDDTK